jgi:excisionase family DNA binding protein
MLNGLDISLDALSRKQLIALAVEVIARLAAPAPAPAAPSNPITRLLTVAEVASALRCTIGHAYELVKQGELAAVRHGKSIVVRASAVEDFISRHEKPDAFRHSPKHRDYIDSSDKKENPICPKPNRASRA